MKDIYIINYVYIGGIHSRLSKASNTKTNSNIPKIAITTLKKIILKPLKTADKTNIITITPSV